MRCPYCNNNETQVKDSRPTEDNAVISRRRHCADCGGVPEKKQNGCLTPNAHRGCNLSKKREIISKHMFFEHSKGLRWVQRHSPSKCCTMMWSLRPLVRHFRGSFGCKCVWENVVSLRSRCMPPGRVFNVRSIWACSYSFITVSKKE